MLVVFYSKSKQQTDFTFEKKLTEKCETLIPVPPGWLRTAFGSIFSENPFFMKFEGPEIYTNDARDMLTNYFGSQSIIRTFEIHSDMMNGTQVEVDSKPKTRLVWTFAKTDLAYHSDDDDSKEPPWAYEEIISSTVKPTKVKCTSRDGTRVKYISEDKFWQIRPGDRTEPKNEKK